MISVFRTSDVTVTSHGPSVCRLPRLAVMTCGADCISRAQLYYTQNEVHKWTLHGVSITNGLQPPGKGHLSVWVGVGEAARPLSVRHQEWEEGALLNRGGAGAGAAPYSARLCCSTRATNHYRRPLVPRKEAGGLFNRAQPCETR